MSKWEMVRLGDVLIYEQPTKYIVHSTDYCDGYNTPVLTAGQSFILGYTNEESNVFSSNLPVIIFDDFTTSIKYVDFPFKVKSSAMKILKATATTNIKFLYYFMSTIKTDTELHKRYWISHYANMRIPLPTLSEQSKIAATLDKVYDLITERKQQLVNLDLLVKSQFVEMFGDPMTNPMGWEVSTLKEVAINKLSYGAGASAINYDNEVRYIRITDITDNGELNNDIVSPSEYDEKFLLSDGDILFARSGATVGKTLRYNEKWGKCIYAGYLIRLVPNISKVLPDYVFGYTKTDCYHEFVKLNQRTVAQPNINAQQYGDLTICVPPLPLQTRFADFVRAADKSKFEIQQGLTTLELQYNALMQKYFG